MTTLFWISYSAMAIAAILAYIGHRKLLKANQLLQKMNKQLRHNYIGQRDVCMEYMKQWHNAYEADAEVVQAEVSAFYKVMKGNLIIKMFCDSDAEYNKLCAQELADHINEQY